MTTKTELLRSVTQTLMDVASTSSDACIRVDACRALAGIYDLGVGPAPAPTDPVQTSEEFERLITCIDWLKVTADGHQPDGEVQKTLMRLAADFEKVIKHKDAQIDVVYGAYLESFRLTFIGGPFVAARGVMQQAAAVLGAMDAKSPYEVKHLPRPRQALFDAVVALVRRRGDTVAG